MTTDNKIKEQTGFYLLSKYLATKEKQGDCLPEEELIKFAEGELDDAAMEQAIDHLNTCLECNKYLKRYQDFLMATENSQEEKTVPEELNKATLEAIRAREEEIIEKTPLLRSISISIANSTFKVLESFKGLNYSLAPSIAYRGKKMEMLSIDFTEKGYDIKGHIDYQTEDTLCLNLTIIKNNTPQDNITVRLRNISHGGGITKSTNNNGNVIFDDLSIDRYTCNILDIEGSEFELNLKDDR